MLVVFALLYKLLILNNCAIICATILNSTLYRFMKRTN